MRLSLHKKRHLSLPPQPRRSPKVLVIVVVVTAATMAFAASRIGRDPPSAESATVRNADAGTRSAVDERLRVHLVRLQRGAAG